MGCAAAVVDMVRAEVGALLVDMLYPGVCAGVAAEVASGAGYVGAGSNDDGRNLPPLRGTGAEGLGRPRAIQMTLFDMQRRPLSERMTTCVDVEWSLAPWR